MMRRVVRQFAEAKSMQSTPPVTRAIALGFVILVTTITTNCGPDASLAPPTPERGRIVVVPRGPHALVDPETAPCGDETRPAPSVSPAPSDASGSRPLRIPRAPQLTWNQGDECVTDHYTIETSQQGSQETPNAADGT